MDDIQFVDTKLVKSPAGFKSEISLSPVEVIECEDPIGAQALPNSGGVAKETDIHRWWAFEHAAPRGLFSLEVSKYCSVFSDRSDIFGAIRPLRSLQNFSLSEWAVASPMVAVKTGFCASTEIREAMVVAPVAVTRCFRPTRWHPQRAGTGRAPKASRCWRRHSNLASVCTV